MLALIRRASFWPPSMVYVSVIITHILEKYDTAARPITISEYEIGSYFEGNET